MALRARTAASRIVPSLAIVSLSALAPTHSAASGSGADINASLSPPVNLVLINDTVPLTFGVGPGSSGFNGYSLTIAYDASILYFLGVDEGPLMTEACGARFVDLVEAKSAVTYAHVVLCASTSIDGPGGLSTFRFLAIRDGETIVRIASDPGCTFVNAGLCVGPQHPTNPRQVTFSDARVIVSDGVLETQPTMPPSPVQLVLAPNPLTGRGLFTIELGDAAHGRLELFDQSGRRRLDRRVATSLLSWDGRDDAGRLLASGRYYARLTSDGRTAGAPVVILR